MTVLVGGLFPLAFNYNPVGDVELDYKTVAANLAIALVGETLVAEGIFCVLAARQQHKAHTFIATWRLRPHGSVLLFVMGALMAFLPVWYALMLYMVVKRQDSDSSFGFGYRSFSKSATDYITYARIYNSTKYGLVDEYDKLILLQQCESVYYVKDWCENLIDPQSDTVQRCMQKVNADMVSLVS